MRPLAAPLHFCYDYLRVAYVCEVLINAGVKLRKGGRAVECAGLENRSLLTGTVSSNLTPSACTQNCMWR